MDSISYNIRTKLPEFKDRNPKKVELQMGECTMKLIFTLGHFADHGVWSFILMDCLRKMRRHN